MTAYPVIVQLTCPGNHRTKGVQFQSTCNLCRESHKTQVWLCFLVLSFFSTSVCAAETQDDVTYLLDCVRPLNETIEKSDAMLYAPSNDDIEGICVAWSLHCYMKELQMVLYEEEDTGSNASCIYEYLVRNGEPNRGSCPECEVHSLQNTTIFLQRLQSLLERINSEAVI